MKLLLSLLFLAVPVMAAPPKTPAKPAAAPAPAASSTEGLDAAVRARIEAFFKNLQEHRVKEGFSRLYEGSNLAADQPVILETHVKNTQLLIEKCGKVESSAILRVRNAGRTLKEVTCILNCQRRPVRWTIYVYFGEGRWQVLDAEVDLELHSFFEDKPVAN
jgi:hypothetical protein